MMFEEADLFEEVFLERGAGHERIEHELAALLVFLPAAERACWSGRTGPAIPDPSGRASRTRPENRPPARSRRFSVAGSNRRSAGGSCGSLGSETAGPSCSWRSRRACSAAGTSSSTGFCGEFLFNQGLQLEHRRLQQCQRLLELRRQHLLQRHALRKMKALSHVVSLGQSALSTSPNSTRVAGGFPIPLRRGSPSAGPPSTRQAGVCAGPHPPA